ncbi:MFS transporter [Candidatus Saccharibacteria bacterium]|nr:MFS transporter [Candidatus Saccharibacteria bacterium]
MRNIRLIILMKFIRDLAFSSAVFNIFFADRGFSVGELAIYFTTIRVAQTILEVPMGMFADRFGRKRSIQLSRLVVIVAFLILIGAQDFWMFIVVAALDGLCNALYSNSDTSIMYDDLRKQGKTKSYAKMIAIYNGLGFVAFAIASLVGVMIAEYSLVATFVMRIPIFMIHFAIAGMVREDRTAIVKSTAHSLGMIKESWKKVIRNRHVMRIIYFGAVIFAFNLIVWDYYQSYGMAINMPLMMFGWMAVGFSVAEGLPQFLAFRFVNPKSFARLFLALVAVSGTLGIVSAILGNMAGFVLLIIAVFVTGFSFPISDAIMHKHAGNKYRTTVCSFGTLFSMLSYAVMSLVFGVIAERAGVFTAFLFVSLVTLGMAVFYIIIHVFRNRLKKYHFIFSDIIVPMVEEEDVGS